MQVELIGIGALYAVLEFLKFIVPMMLPSKSGLSPEESHMMNQLYDMHMVKDKSGRPLWYMPETVANQQEKILDILNELSKNIKESQFYQKQTAQILDRVVERISQP